MTITDESPLSKMMLVKKGIKKKKKKEKEVEKKKEKKEEKSALNILGIIRAEASNKRVVTGPP